MSDNDNNSDNEGSKDFNMFNPDTFHKGFDDDISIRDENSVFTFNILDHKNEEEKEIKENKAKDEIKPKDTNFIETIKKNKDLEITIKQNDGNNSELFDKNNNDISEYIKTKLLKKIKNIHEKLKKEYLGKNEEIKEKKNVRKKIKKF